MSILRNGNLVDYTFLHNGAEMDAAYHNGTVELWSAGKIVTYAVDDGVRYQEKVKKGATVLSPTTFTPTKSGWTFTGWREDTTASGSVLTSKVMGDEPISLYAVFQQNVTITFQSGLATSPTSVPLTGQNYYNNGNKAPATVTAPTGASAGSNWSWRGWSGGSETAANATMLFSNGSAVSSYGNCTCYGLYSQGITATFYSGGTSDTRTSTRYYNSAGNTINGSVTTPDGRASNYGSETWTWRGWSGAGVTTSNATVTYANGATISGLTGNASFYGLYQIYRYVYYYNNSDTKVATDGCDYYNDYGNVTRAQFNLTVASVSGWSARGWARNSRGASAGISFSSGTSYYFSGNVNNGDNLYASWSKSVSATAKSYNSTQTMTGTAYRDYKGTTTDATTTTPTGATYSGWTWRGWSASGDTGASASVIYTDGASINLGTSGEFTIYGLYYQDVTLSYAAGGGSGSMSPQPATRYYNAYGSTHNPTLTLAANGFTRTDYTFTGWDLGAVGASVTMDGNKTATAQWKAASLTVFSTNVSLSAYSASESGRSINSTYFYMIYGGVQYPFALDCPSGDSGSGHNGMIQFSSAAQSQFTTAEITFKYGYAVSYGDLDFSFAGQSLCSGSYAYIPAATATKTISINIKGSYDTAYWIEYADRSATGGQTVFATIAIEKIVLKA